MLEFQLRPRNENLDNLNLSLRYVKLCAV